MLNYSIVPVTNFYQNCSIWVCTETQLAAIIDPGGDLNKIINEINILSCKPSKILLTHGHIDHIGAAKLLSNKFNIPIVGPHIGDLFWFEGVNGYAEILNMEPMSPFLPDQWLEDGMTIKLGDLTFDVLHCPGHTPGHLAFFEKNNAVISVGDIIFQGSIGRTDLPGGNHEQLIRSIKDKLLPLGENVTFIPGHGPQSTLGIEKTNNPFLQ